MLHFHKLKKNLFSTCRLLHSSEMCRMKSMRAWQAYQYGTTDSLQLDTAQIPIIQNTTDVLVKVHAASINPLDVRMLDGYGAATFSFMKQLTSCCSKPKEFPLILGRDFSGIVVHIGKGVKDLKVGDEVWGAVSPFQDGSHADYIIGSIYNTSKKPKCLNHTEAASLPYAALTAWSALCIFGQLNETSAYGKRILITGASGGVGTFAVQLLKSWGADVTVTCSTDAVDMLLDLGADAVLDYQSPDFKNNLKDLNGLDFIFDNVGKNYPELTTHLLKSWKSSKYVTVVSPLLKNADDKGLLLGTFISGIQAGLDTAMTLKDGRSFRWAYFIPDSRSLKRIASMVDKQQIKPVIQEVFSFEEMPRAYENLLNGHARGKTVVNYESSKAENEISQDV